MKRMYVTALSHKTPARNALLETARAEVTGSRAGTGASSSTARGRSSSAASSRARPSSMRSARCSTPGLVSGQQCSRRPLSHYGMKITFTLDEGSTTKLEAFAYLVQLGPASLVINDFCKSPKRISRCRLHFSTIRLSVRLNLVQLARLMMVRLVRCTCLIYLLTNRAR